MSDGIDAANLENRIDASDGRVWRMARQGVTRRPAGSHRAFSLRLHSAAPVPCGSGPRPCGLSAAGLEVPRSRAGLPSWSTGLRPVSFAPPARVRLYRWRRGRMLKTLVNLTTSLMEKAVQAREQTTTARPMRLSGSRKVLRPGRPAPRERWRNAWRREGRNPMRACAGASRSAGASTGRR